MTKDIFEEDKISPIKGLLQRYKDRVLIELTFKCPSECPFCYRKWRRSQNDLDLNMADVDKIVDFIANDKKISQIIFSGGEPLLRLDLLKYFFQVVLLKIVGVKR
jgi:lysine 2,3-aminomutase